MSAGDGEAISTDDSGNYVVKVYNAVPDWVYNLRPLAMLASGTIAFLAAFAQNPVEFVTQVILGFIVNSFLQAGAYIVGTILAGFDLVVGALSVAQSLLVGAFGAAGLDILGALLSVQRMVADVVGAAGPAGPPLAVLFAAVGIYALYRLAIALAVLVPGGDSLLTLIGLR